MILLKFRWAGFEIIHFVNKATIEILLSDQIAACRIVLINTRTL